MLREVVAQFPNSRDAHRELGFSFYQQQQYEAAKSEYEIVQSIDPDDLSAHYILSIVYRRLGMKDKAAHEATYFSDQKDDPTATTYALEFLRKHPDVTAESVVWHIHKQSAVDNLGTGVKAGQ
jgi:tetratricopeptide (TPR) repeat protein